MTKKSDIYTEEGLNLASKVPDEIALGFRKQAKETPGQNLKSNLACAAKVWLCLPTELQSKLLSSMNKKNLYPLLKEWISGQIASEFESKLSESQKELIVAISEKMKL